MSTRQPTFLLSLPNELFLYHIFIYLRSTQLLYSFGQLYNRRLSHLLSAYIHHIDFSTTDISSIPIDKWLSYFSSLKTISSLRINSNYFDYSLSSICSRLNRLDLQLTASTPQNISQLFSFTQLKKLSITSTSTKAERVEGLISFIWQSNSCLEYLSASNCFILDKSDLFPSSSCFLMINRKLTRLLLDLGHICIAIALMPFVPALEHFEVRLHDIYNQRSAFTTKFLQRRKEWPTNVISLRFISYDQLMDTVSFCEFVKRFSLSLEYLSFYMSTHQRFLMSTQRTFETYLLDYLSRLKHIDYCVYNGVMNIHNDRRTTFDSWTKNQVISVYHSRGFHTRFTLPFTFDRPEQVSNDFVDYHCNFSQSNIITLPSIVMIIFQSYPGLNLALFTFIKQICPSLRHLCFHRFFNLSDDLIQDTKLVLPNVTELCLKDVTLPTDYLVVRRIFSLTPCLKHFVAEQHNITTIDIMKNDMKILGHNIKITIVERH